MAYFSLLYGACGPEPHRRHFAGTPIAPRRDAEATPCVAYFSLLYGACGPEPHRRHFAGTPIAPRRDAEATPCVASELEYPNRSLGDRLAIRALGCGPVVTAHQDVEPLLGEILVQQVEGVSQKHQLVLWT